MDGASDGNHDVVGGTGTAPVPESTPVRDSIGSDQVENSKMPDVGDDQSSGASGMRLLIFRLLLVFQCFSSRLTEFFFLVDLNPSDESGNVAVGKGLEVGDEADTVASNADRPGAVESGMIYL